MLAESRRPLQKGASLYSLRYPHCSHLLASGVPSEDTSAEVEQVSEQEVQPIMDRRWT
jgi:hypothetical protein